MFLYISCDVVFLVGERGPLPDANAVWGGHGVERFGEPWVREQGIRQGMVLKVLKDTGWVVKTWISV